MRKNSMERGLPHRKRRPVIPVSKVEVDDFAEALAPTTLDPVGEFMVFTARMVERGNVTEPARHHAIKALDECRPGPEHDMHMGFFDAVKRLVNAYGLDHADFSIEETIDNLVGAAYWDIP